jgi:hypothetical protein
VTTFVVVKSSASSPLLGVLSFFGRLSGFSLSNGQVLEAFRYWPRQIRLAPVSESYVYRFVVNKDILWYCIYISILLVQQKSNKP